MDVKSLDRTTEFYIHQLPNFFSEELRKLDRYYSTSFINGYIKKRDEDYFRKMLNQNSKGIFLGLEETNLVGVLEYSSHKDGNLQIGDVLWLLSRIKKNGIGSKLLEFCLEDFKSRNLDIAALTVSEANLNAISLYEKKGFRYIRNRGDNSAIYAQALNDKGKEIVK